MSPSFNSIISDAFATSKPNIEVEYFSPLVSNLSKIANPTINTIMANITNRIFLFLNILMVWLWK